MKVYGEIFKKNIEVRIVSFIPLIVFLLI
jgi:hypothetical protein